MPTSRDNDLYDRELTRFREALAKDPDAALDLYGVALLHSLDPATRAQALRSWGFELSEPLDYYNLGVGLASQENWSEAILYFKKAAEEDPNLTGAIYNLALCYEKTGHIPQARQMWQLYLDAAPREEAAKIQKHLDSLD